MNLISGLRILSLFQDHSAIFLGYTDKNVFKNGPENVSGSENNWLTFYIFQLPGVLIFFYWQVAIRFLVRKSDSFSVLRYNLCPKNQNNNNAMVKLTEVKYFMTVISWLVCSRTFLLSIQTNFALRLFQLKKNWIWNVPEWSGYVLECSRGPPINCPWKVCK